MIENHGDLVRFADERLRAPADRLRLDYAAPIDAPQALKYRDLGGVSVPIWPNGRFATANPDLTARPDGEPSCSIFLSVDGEHLAVGGPGEETMSLCTVAWRPSANRWL